MAKPLLKFVLLQEASDLVSSVTLLNSNNSNPKQFPWSQIRTDFSEEDVNQSLDYLSKEDISLGMFFFM